MAGPPTSVTTPEGKTYVRHAGSAHLTYTPMIHAKIFSSAKQTSRGADGQFDLTTGEEGGGQEVAGIEGGDRPVFVQVSYSVRAELIVSSVRTTPTSC
jgi:tRNA-dihydrouridine synthase 1